MNVGIALLALVLQVSAPAPPKATIEGSVLRAGSGDPVSGVRVTLTKPAEPRTVQTAALERLRPPAAIPSAVTDAQGKFQLKDVDAGTYRLAFAANGFVRTEYGQKIFPGQGTPVEVSSGQAIKGLAVQLSPTAIVSGRVSDAGRQPVAVVPVHMMRFTYDVNGRRNLQPVASTQTDDRGEYRIYNLTPGRYYLAAGMLREAAPARPFNGAMTSYAVTYYPGFSEIGNATPIEIKPGSELNIDVSMTPQRLYRIRGKVTDARLGQPPSSVIIGLTTSSTSGSSSYEVNGESITYSSADGSFEVRGVLPGAYLMTVTWGDSMQLSNATLATLGAPVVTPPPPGPQAPVDPEAQRLRSQQTSAVFATVREGIAYSRISIGTADVENLALTLLPGGAVSGRVRMEVSDAAPLQSVKVQLKPSVDGLPANVPGVYQPRAGDLTADGTFSIPSIKMGEYRVSVDGLPAGYFIKEARIGATDILNRPFQFTPDGSNIPVEIVIAPGAASVSGTVSNEKSEVLPGGQVVLVPERTRDRLDLFKTATSDARGRYTFSSVPPGDYKVIAWEALEPNAYFDPEQLKQADAQGKSIHVTELSAPTVDLRVVPVQPAF